MKQLLIANHIVTSLEEFRTASDAGTLYFEAQDSTKPQTFAIYLTRPNGQMPFCIPEVDYKSLTVAVAGPSPAVAMKATVTIKPSTKELGFVIVKKGTVPHERNTNTFSVAGTNNATTDAASLVKAFNTRNEIMGLPFTVTASTTTVTIECTKAGELYTVLPLGDVTVTETQTPKPAIGDKAYIEFLASQCAAGKGFRDTDAVGREYLPGYPEEVEEGEYYVWTLRFAVPRVSAKTRDEVVNQVVHIATKNADVNSHIYDVFKNRGYITENAFQESQPENLT